MNENPFRSGDRVLFVGNKRAPKRVWVLTIANTNYLGKITQPPFAGVVRGIWRKGWRHMVDVHFPLHGDFVCYPEELEFIVLDTLGAI